MKAKTIHCEECVEDIPSDEVYWEDDRLYCGRCGSELDVSKEAGDLLDAFTKRRSAKWQTADDEEEFEDEDFDEEEEEEDWEIGEEDDLEEEEEEDNGRRR